MATGTRIASAYRIVREAGRERLGGVSVALALLPLAWTLACGTGTAGGPGSDAGMRGSADAAPPSLEQACADLYTAMVAWSACSFQLNAVGDRTRYLTFCESRLGAPGVAPAALSAAEGCASALQMAAPTCAPLPPDVCAVPAGILPAGAPCGVAMQCKSLFCSAAGQTIVESGGSFLSTSAALSTCGHCVDAVPIGGSCQAVNQCTLGCWAYPAPCASGGTCIAAAPASTAGTCVACPPVTGITGGGGPFLPTSCPGSSGTPPAGGTVVAGGACGSTSECKQGLLCVDRTCVQGRKLGESCVLDDAGTPDCYGAALCDPRTKVCTAQRFPAPGAPCDSSDGFACASGQCAFTPDGGTCPLLVPDGQPCTVGQPSSPSGTCQDFAVCVSSPAAQGCCSSTPGPAPSGGPAGGGGPGDVQEGGATGGDASSTPSGPTCVFFDPRTCR